MRYFFLNLAHMVRSTLDYRNGTIAIRVQAGGRVVNKAFCLEELRQFIKRYYGSALKKHFVRIECKGSELVCTYDWQSVFSNKRLLLLFFAHKANHSQ